jgi:hypothetical protein
MGTSTVQALRAFLGTLAWRMRDQAGQATTEYALVSFAIIVGGSFSLFYFIPTAINAYRGYIRGFYLVLGLPIP